MALYPTPKYVVGDHVVVRVGALCGDDVMIEGQVTAYYLGEEKDFPTDPYWYKIDTLPKLCGESKITEVREDIAIAA